MIRVEASPLFRDIVRSTFAQALAAEVLQGDLDRLGTLPREEYHRVLEVLDAFLLRIGLQRHDCDELLDLLYLNEAQR